MFCQNLKLIFCVAGATLLSSCGGGGGGSSGSSVVTPPPPANRPPAVSSPATLSVSEVTTGDIYTLTASDSDGTIATIALDTSNDANVFSFDSNTGILSLPSRLNFDAPADSGGDNIYDLSFTVTDDDGAATNFDLTITVTQSDLDPAKPPSGNFDLLDWKLDLPINDSGGFTGRSATVSELDLSTGYESEFFYTGADGGIVFVSPPQGATTSAGAQFARTELREMLRRGDTSISTRGSDGQPNLNNWAFSSAPIAAQNKAGGVDGTLRVTIAVNDVTETGSSGQVGRVIIGQIHAKDDEPIRLYYRKLPDNVNGTIYAGHEINGGDDVWYEIIGSRDNDAPNPANGIPLNTQFTYEIIAVGNLLTVNILQNETLLATTDIDMTNSGYDIADDFMYFKAGLYHVNNTADATDTAQVTIYELENTHDGYAF